MGCAVLWCSGMDAGMVLGSGHQYSVQCAVIRSAYWLAVTVIASTNTGRHTHTPGALAVLPYPGTCDNHLRVMTKESCKRQSSVTRRDTGIYWRIWGTDE